MNKIKAVISDADGTLVDTAYLIRRGQYEAVVEYMLAHEISKQEIPTYEEYEQHLNKSVGGNTRDTFEKTLKSLFSKTHGHILKEIDFAELDKSLDPIQDRIAKTYVHPFPGLTDLFTWTGKNQIKLGVFTSGTPYHAVRNFGICLPDLGYSELFLEKNIDIHQRLQSFISRTLEIYKMPEFAILTCEDISKGKPDPEGLLKLMDQLEVKPDEILVLGDHSVDILAAKAAKAHAIGISHGFGLEADLLKAGAIKVVHNLTSITELIDDHNTGKIKLF